MAVLCDTEFSDVPSEKFIKAVGDNIRVFEHFLRKIKGIDFFYFLILSSYLRVS